MRKLTLMRHAKSSWSDRAKADIDRPLTARGRLGALAVGTYMARNKIFPDIILCSPARRTRETLAQIEPSLPDGFERRFNPAVYSAGTGAGLLASLKCAAISEAHVMVIGHNPAMQQLALSLMDPASNLYKEIARKFPRGGLIQFAFDIDDWREMHAPGRVLHFTTPKRLIATEEEEE
ncbi:SixA phosphatase family protein [Sneathiella sp.]|uniref:SixA phosphatase family protein n=1 Tax=Sneathiella sp. TaxID=1964365 RepID=UPI002FE3F93A